MSFLKQEIIQKGYLKNQKKLLNSISQIGVEPAPKKRRYNYKQIINPFERKYVTPFLKLVNDDDDDDDNKNKQKKDLNQQPQNYRASDEPNNSMPLLRMSVEPLELTTMNDIVKDTANQVAEKTAEKVVEEQEKQEEIKHKTEEIEREVKRKTEEAERKIEEKQREDKRKAKEELKRQAEDLKRKIEEIQRKTKEKQEEAKRKAEEEAKRKAEEEAKRKAEEAKRKTEEFEAKRKAEEFEAKRKAEEKQEEIKRKIEEIERKTEEKLEEKKRKIEEIDRKIKERDREAKRKIEEIEREAKRKAEEREREAKRQAEEEAKLVELYDTLTNLRFKYEVAPEETLHLSTPSQEKYSQTLIDHAIIVKRKIDATEKDLQKLMTELEFNLFKHLHTPLKYFDQHPENSPLRQQLEKLKKEIRDLKIKLSDYSFPSDIFYTSTVDRLKQEKKEKKKLASDLSAILERRDQRGNFFDQQIANHH